MKAYLRPSLLLAVSLLTGCVQDPDDRDFFYRGWVRPRTTAEDRDFFYKGKARSGPPEQPRLPSGEVQ